MHDFKDLAAQVNIIPGLHIHLLGGFELHQGEVTLGAESFRLRKACDLFKLLVLASHHRMPRDQVMEWLWPDGDPKASTNSLGQALHAARQVLDIFQPAIYIHNSDGILELVSEEALWVDVEAFEAAAAQASRSQKLPLYQAALELYAGELLPEDRYAEWTIQRREALQQAYRDLLLEFAALTEKNGDHKAAIATFQSLIAFDPLLEEAHAGLMRCYALSGQRSQALRQYQLLQDTLRKELASEPDRSTQELYQHILAGIYPTGPQVQAANHIMLAQETPRHNLPMQLTSFIGREQEMAQVKELLASHRLVTLTGSGGVGKTRLSIQVAANLLENYPNGAWLVELAPLTDPALVPYAVASALSLPEIPGKSLIDSLVDFLRQKSLLLILDNCEHLLDTCASLADKLLHACPDLAILTSSREILGVVGEIPYRVPPLSLPDIQHLPPLVKLREFDAVRVFVERAQLVLPGFELSETNGTAVAQIVNRLDGIPLAIELAAARLRLLSVEQIALRLDDAFRLLTSGSRIALPRHHTLRALIDWSYSLLSKPERILLRRLSVFAGSWTLEAAEQVCAHGVEAYQPLCPEDVLDLLSGLVDKSLVQTVEVADGLNRFTMLETIRQYAHEKLVDEKEDDIVCIRHLAYYLKWVEELEPKIRSQEQIETLNRLEVELDNLRLAMEWALQTDLEAELKLATALNWFWDIHDHHAEAISWLERGLQAEKDPQRSPSGSGVGAAVRAKSLTCLGFHRWLQLYYFPQEKPFLEQINDLVNEAIFLYQSIGSNNNPDLAWTFVCKGNYQIDIGGDPDQTLVMAKEALHIFRENNDQNGIAESLQLLSYFEVDPMRAIPILQEQLAIYKSINDAHGMANALWRIGSNNVVNGDYDDACSAFEASLGQYQRNNNLSQVMISWRTLGVVSHFKGDLQRAAQCIQQSLDISLELGSEIQIVRCLLPKVDLFLTEGHYVQANEVNESAWHIAQNTNSQDIMIEALSYRARLARVLGNLSAAQEYVEKLMTMSQKNTFQWVPTLPELHESGYLALQMGEPSEARKYFVEGIQLLIRKGYTFRLPFPLEGLALVEAREYKMERAARLFGTRWCRGGYNLLSPDERSQRESTFNEIKAVLGERQFNKVYQEGKMMTFAQMIKYTLEENE
jgi:predicted ATPase/DNA-binding SARP family transcriptional activator